MRVSQRLRVARFEQNHIAADFAGQGLRRAQRHQISFVQNGEPIAAFGFFHQMSRDDDRDALLIAKNLKILPKIAAGAGIEPGSRLVKQQNLGMMQQSLGQFDAALHASGKSFHAIGARGRAIRRGSESH